MNSLHRVERTHFLGMLLYVLIIVLRAEKGLNRVTIPGTGL